MKCYTSASLPKFCVKRMCNFYTRKHDNGLVIIWQNSHRATIKHKWSPNFNTFSHHNNIGHFSFLTSQCMNSKWSARFAIGLPDHYRQPSYPFLDLYSFVNHLQLLQILKMQLNQSIHFLVVVLCKLVEQTLVLRAACVFEQRGYDWDYVLCKIDAIFICLSGLMLHS